MPPQSVTLRISAKTALRRLRWQIGYKLKRRLDALVGWIIGPLFRFTRRFDRVWLSNFVGALMRNVGPWLPEHRTGQKNLAAAFPDKSAAEIEAILAGVWDNLGRVSAEFVSLDRICAGERWRYPNIERSAVAIERSLRLRDDGKPALVFGAHLANWELPPVIAESDGIDFMVLYRRPSMGSVANAIVKLRANVMGTIVAAGFDAPIRLARGLEQGRHVGILVDQHDARGIPVTFFGRRCLVNPLIAVLARQIECPIYGVRVIRLPDGRFAAEISEELQPARNAEGRIDVAGTMQAITTVVEGWVREHPEQWLWLHRRWR